MRWAPAAFFALTAVVSAQRLWAAVFPAPPPGAEQAARANPRDSKAWIEWGLELELAGDFASAEQALLQAAHFDRQYQPSWTLANFYFRRGDRERFWKWARRAAPLIPDDPRPLLTLAHNIDLNALTRVGGSDVLTRLGGGQRLTRSYLDYLLGLPDYTTARGVALQLAALGDRDDNARIADTAGKFLAAQEPAAAIELWNTRFEKLDAARGPWIVNASLQHKPAGIGFEAALPLCPGVTVAWRPGQLHYDLDGTQSDGCVFYDQPVAAARGKRLRVAAPFEPLVHGLSWTIAGQPPRLKVIYRRPQGQPRARGSVVLRTVNLEPL